MFNRLKAAVDSKIQEELERARNPGVVRKPSGPSAAAAGNARANALGKEKETTGGDEDGEFDSGPSTAAGTPARTGTPNPDGEKKERKEEGPINVADLPTEVRVKLRKLEKYEKRYAGKS